MEEWEDIPGFEGLYQASSLGQIRSLNYLRTGQIKNLSQSLNGPAGNQSLRVCLWKYGIQSQEKVHKLVGLAFLPNLENKLTIDHIDRNHFNNNLSNLRWATHTEQNLNRHYDLGASGHRHILKRGDSYYVQICRGGRRVFSKTFPTLEEAVKARDTFLASLK